MNGTSVCQVLCNSFCFNREANAEAGPTALYFALNLVFLQAVAIVHLIWLVYTSLSFAKYSSDVKLDWTVSKAVVIGFISIYYPIITGISLMSSTILWVLEVVCIRLPNMLAERLVEAETFLIHYGLAVSLHTANQHVRNVVKNE
jgi:hypothetical protein